VLLIEIDDLTTLGSGVETIWQGAAVERKHELPLFVIGSEAKSFIDRHKSRSLKHAAPALYTISDAEVHGLGVVHRDDWLLGGEGWPGLTSLTTPSPRLFGQSVEFYFKNVAPTPRRRRIEGVALLLTHPGDKIYGHWLIDLFPLVWLTATVVGVHVKYIVREKTPDYAMHWLERSGASKSDIIFYQPESEILEVERLVIGTGLRRLEFFFTEIKQYRDWFERLAGVDVSAVREGERKIYISRVGSRTPYRELLNRDEVEAQALKHGFEVYRPELDPLDRQIDTFRHARLIVGESGSGLHNSMFAGSDAVIGSLVAWHRQSLIQSALCAAFGQRIVYATGEPFLRGNLPLFGAIAPWVIAPEFVDQLMSGLEELN
jgi:Glycosyltransferase 61